MSAPARRDSPDGTWGSWTNPCGGNPTEAEISPRSEIDILSNIKLASDRALDMAVEISDGYAKETMGFNFNDTNMTWESAHLNWLPSREEVPKAFGKQIPVHHLERLELDEFLTQSYRHLQILAIALGKVYNDMERDSHKYTPQFMNMIGTLNSLMCEVQSAMHNRHLPVKTLNERKLVKIIDQQRSSGSSATNVNDWIIFREYMNILEYVALSSEYLMTGVHQRRS